MTGLNHAVTRALVAASINNPVLALPAAFLSHFVIDAIPHWNYKLGDIPRQLLIMMDLTLTLSVLLILSVTVDASARMIIVGGFLGILPDAMWLPHILRDKKAPSNKNTPIHVSRRLHGKIQWSESSKGLYIEIAWFTLMLFLIYQL